MLLIKGRSVYSQFRYASRLAQLQSLVPNITKFSAETVYFIEMGHMLEADDYQRLFDLLDAKQEATLRETDQMILVMPRHGTVSPWSSRATDIAQACGLANAGRIERGIVYQIQVAYAPALTDSELHRIYPLLHDPMTETVGACFEDAQMLFAHNEPGLLRFVDVTSDGSYALVRADEHMGLALNKTEIDYLTSQYQQMKRNPTDVELMMYAQANSEHCRHKIFNASWEIDGQAQDQSLFAMIKTTHQRANGGTLSAYSDNAAVLSGRESKRFWCDPSSKLYGYHQEAVNLVIKVETHNHPTAISPYPGAATGVGGEIRDEGATGIGAKPKSGLVGYCVSNLQIPHFTHGWEIHTGKPENIASALQIMLEAPIGAARYSNEFGRPSLCGFFRTLEVETVHQGKALTRGFHKPIMLAGGLGNIRSQHVAKRALYDGAHVVVLGGPGMPIGIGGGAASSQTSTDTRQALDFASVQRGDAEMERRCQEVIDACWTLGDDNPILSIHDVGAGGLANAIPELVAADGGGGHFELRAIPSDDTSMSPLAIWCNESQERYVIAIDKAHLAAFEMIAERERCPFSVVGMVTADPNLLVCDAFFDNVPIEIPMSLLFEGGPKQHLTAHSVAPTPQPLSVSNDEFATYAHAILAVPAVADKSFLITIGDRSVGGLTARDQMVGPWQIPVSDCAVTSSGFSGSTGEAMAVGERTPLALLNAKASARMAVAEALTNLMAAPLVRLDEVRLSANWMADMSLEGEGANLYAAVETVTQDICPPLGISIPVGKDSLSMAMRWQQQGQLKRVSAPMSLIVSAFASVDDVTATLTAYIREPKPQTQLWFIDLADGQQRLGGSVLAQVLNQLGEQVPDLVDVSRLQQAFNLISALREQQLIQAYHDRSDGGLWACLCEMAFASHCGLRIKTDVLGEDIIAGLFNEELGMVIAIDKANEETLKTLATNQGLAQQIHHIATVTQDDTITVVTGRNTIFSATRSELQQAWSATSYHMQLQRDEPISIEQGYSAIAEDDPGLFAEFNFAVPAPSIISGVQPKLAVLREQGVNGHIEMAAAFSAVGFDCIDVHMTDLSAGRINLKNFKGLVACGGFSFGDVLGAGNGWAKSILLNESLRDIFADYFTRSDTFTLGVCNGCQMLAKLRPIIADADIWPEFVSNQSEQFEARLSMVQVTNSPSLFFRDMVGAKLPIVVSHGEGRVQWRTPESITVAREKSLVAMQYIDNHGEITQRYPANPNGSPRGITAVTTPNGRITLMMPHPERVFRSQQFSWCPANWGEYSPWLKMFKNAREWLG